MIKIGEKQTDFEFVNDLVICSDKDCDGEIDFEEFKKMTLKM